LLAVVPGLGRRRLVRFACQKPWAIRAPMRRFCGIELSVLCAHSRMQAKNEAILFRGGKLGKIWKGAQFCHDQHHGPISRNEQLWHVLAQAKQLPFLHVF
ncbi:hypothetical protein, partial [Massilia genomosp. 1]|uniref:hypothetical protein n=1 Tax=Massilia genomosp. 1 TaxID=2609280 RepID=UPI001C9E9831